jgi:hypothetical protein
VKLTARALDAGDRLVARYDLRDRLADGGVIRERPEVDRSRGQDERREPGEDLHLRAHVGGRSGLAAVGDANVVEHALLRRALRFLVARQGGQHERGPAAAVDVTLVQLRRDEHRGADAAHRAAGEATIGRRREQVPAEQQRGVDASLGGRLDAGQRVHARLVRKRHAVERPEAACELRLQRRRHAHRAHALHVGMTADREQSGAGTADPAPGQGEIGERVDIADPVRVLRDNDGTRDDPEEGRAEASERVDHAEYAHHAAVGRPIDDEVHGPLLVGTLCGRTSLR